MSNALLQTVTFRIGVDVTDKSRRNDHTAQAGYDSGGNYTKYERLLASGASLAVEVPAQILYVLTGGVAVDVQITWSGTTPLVRTFRVNKMLFLSDMTDITAIQITNNSIAVGTNLALSESVRIITL